MHDSVGCRRSRCSLRLHASPNTKESLVAFHCRYAVLRNQKKNCSNRNVAFISISSACIITMVGVGVEEPDPHVQATITDVSFPSAFVSVANIVFAYLGHAGFFTFMSELKDPKDFPKALYVLQAFDVTFYLVVAIVVYRYAGADVESPALGSTAETVKRIAYGIAIPTIIVAGVVYIHVRT